MVTYSIQQPTDNNAVIFKFNIYDIYCIYSAVRCMKHANPSVMLRFKFHLLHGMEQSEIYSTIKCIHSCTVHQDRQHLET